MSSPAIKRPGNWLSACRIFEPSSKTAFPHRVVVPEDYSQISRNTGQTPSSAHVGSTDAAKPRASTSSSSMNSALGGLCDPGRLSAKQPFYVAGVSDIPLCIVSAYLQVYNGLDREDRIYAM